MAAFLLTWNPRVYAWSDLAADVRKVRQRGALRSDWSCARSKQIRAGDRIYLLRQGTPPRGIVGSGRAIGDWYEGPGWRRPGVPCNYVDIEFDVLLDPAQGPILPREALPRGMHWDTQVSGIRIPDKPAKELEKLWRSFLRGAR